MAEEGVRALATALSRVVADGDDLDARTEAQYGAWLCGAVLGATTMSLHHKLCHTLDGTLDLPHAQTHTVVLPHALAYNAPAAPHAVASPYANPRPVIREAVEALLRAAWTGEPPRRPMTV
jgi:maleylacetate reductase